MDKHLAAHAFFADEYSIADIALYPWGGRDTNGTASISPASPT